MIRDDVVIVPAKGRRYLSRYKTTVVEGGPLGAKTLHIVYHDTAIVQRYLANCGRWFITLDSGGWHSVTTKRKMSQASREWDLGYSIWQHKMEWFVATKAGTFAFDDRAFTFDVDTGLPAAALEPFIHNKESAE